MKKFLKIFFFILSIGCVSSYACAMTDECQNNNDEEEVYNLNCEIETDQSTLLNTLSGIGSFIYSQRYLLMGLASTFAGCYFLYHEKLRAYQYKLNHQPWRLAKEEWIKIFIENKEHLQVQDVKIGSYKWYRETPRYLQEKTSFFLKFTIKPTSPTWHTDGLDLLIDSRDFFSNFCGGEKELKELFQILLKKFYNGKNLDRLYTSLSKVYFDKYKLNNINYKEKLKIGKYLFEHVTDSFDMPKHLGKLAGLSQLTLDKLSNVSPGNANLGSTYH